MANVVVVTHLTLDGVMQAPARADEDTRGGFERGGWSPPYGDDVMGGVMAEGMKNSGAMLLGRRTYEDLATVWPHMPADNPYTAAINGARKYVASTTLTEPLEWNNSTLVQGDAAAAVATLKTSLDKDLTVLGSGVLVRSLLEHGLVDRFVLTIHPLVLGSGRRLFVDGGPPATLRLVDTKPTTTGVVIAIYEPA